MLEKLPKNICVLTRIRNEEKIIQDFLDYYGDFPIYIYDDASTDNTRKIIHACPSVRGVIECDKWDEDRTRAEYETRQAVFELAKKDHYDWFIYVDADERIIFPDIDYEKYDAVKMKLFDFYITNEDVEKNYNERLWIGPEYREITMMFRNLPHLKYEHRDQREMRLPESAKIAHAGYVKHYGKAISVEQWEETCLYYMNHFPEPYKTKWKNRQGKAVHTLSDFGAELIRWYMIDDYGYPL